MRLELKGRGTIKISSSAKKSKKSKQMKWGNDGTSSQIRNMPTVIDLEFCKEQQASAVFTLARPATGIEVGSSL